MIRGNIILRRSFVMSIRNKLLGLSASVALLCAGASHAENKVVPVDYGIESNSATLLLPSSSAGSVLLTCSTCKQQSFQLTSETLFKVGQSTVTFAEFSALLRSPPVRNVMIFVTPNKSISRMTVSAPAPASP